MALSGCGGSSGGVGGESGGSVVDDAAARAAAFEALKAEVADPERVPNPPEVTPVRWVRPEELPALSDACLTAQGFPKNADGAMDTPADRMDEFWLAVYVCTLRYPVLPKYTQPEGEPQKRAAYTWTVEYLVPCLAANGYALTTPVPSEAAFVDSWGTERAFFPYEELNARTAEFGISNATMARLERECPQMPPSSVMWDGMSVAEYSALHPIRSSVAPSGS